MMMVTRFFELLLDFRYQLALYFGYNLLVILLLWLFYARMDPLSEQDASDASGETTTAERKQENDLRDKTTSVAGDRTPTVSRARLLSIQPKVSFLDLRLTDTSNRSLQDSIWATPTKSLSPSRGKTPYTQKKTREAPTKYKQPLPHDDLCSNRAQRCPEEPSLQEKMKTFERKNMGILPCFDNAFQSQKNTRSRLRRNRSSPKLRHSVLTWWAGVEQEDPSGEPPREQDEASEFEEHSDCSVCEIIHPWDSWSAAVHNLRTANGQDRNLKIGRTFTNFDQVTLAPSASRVH